MLNKLLHIESIVRYRHHMQMMIEYCYMCTLVRKVVDREIEIIPFVIKLSH
jgi:hypothetical protein